MAEYPCLHPRLTHRCHHKNSEFPAKDNRRVPAREREQILPWQSGKLPTERKMEARERPRRGAKDAVEMLSDEGKRLG